MEGKQGNGGKTGKWRENRKMEGKQGNGGKIGQKRGTNYVKKKKKRKAIFRKVEKKGGNESFGTKN